MFSDLQPPRAMGALVGAAISGWCFLMVAVLVWRASMLDIGTGPFAAYLAATLFLGLGGLFAYWTYCCLTLRYHMDRNGLTIRWGDVRQLIPIDRIEAIIPGRDLPDPKISGVSWVGHHVGHAHVGALGDVMFYATHRSHEELLYVVTEGGTYGITVKDEARFVEDLEGHQKMGQVVSLPQVTERHSIAAMPFWRDTLAMTLALGAVAACAVTLGYVFQNYGDLANSIPFAYPSFGGVTRIDDKRELLMIPITGLGFLAVNLAMGIVAHAWERAIGYLLFTTAIGLQIVLLAAAIITLHQ
jgi:hypothetical protein